MKVSSELRLMPSIVPAVTMPSYSAMFLYVRCAGYTVIARLCDSQSRRAVVASLIRDIRIWQNYLLHYWHGERWRGVYVYAACAFVAYYPRSLLNRDSFTAEAMLHVCVFVVLALLRRPVAAPHATS